MMNLHEVVRSAVTGLHADEAVYRYQSLGQKNVSGKMQPTYADAESLWAQIQSESDDKLFHSNRADENSITRAFYVYTASGNAVRVAGIVRPLARNGDMFYRPLDKTWWLVVGVVEDFSAAGWSKIRCTMQVNPPFGATPPPEPEPDPEPPIEETP